MARDFDIEPTPETVADLRRLIRVLREMGEEGKGVRSQLRSALRKAATPALREAKASIRSAPSKRQGRSQLRAAIARVTRVQVRLTGDPVVRIVVSRKQLGTQGTLPKAMNRGAWTHPVPHTATRVVQTGKRDWFDAPMHQATPRVRREVEAVARDLERRLNRG